MALRWIQLVTLQKSFRQSTSLYSQSKMWIHIRISIRTSTSRKDLFRSAACLRQAKILRFSRNHSGRNRRCRLSSRFFPDIQKYTLGNIRHRSVSSRRGSQNDFNSCRFNVGYSTLLRTQVIRAWGIPKACQRIHGILGGTSIRDSGSRRNNSSTWKNGRTNRTHGSWNTKK